jgi:hypothetical protein
MTNGLRLGAIAGITGVSIFQENAVKERERCKDQQNIRKKRLTVEALEEVLGMSEPG